MFEVQVRAPFELSQLVLPGMRARQWGAILNISSKGAVHPAGPPFGSGPGTTVYGMVKAALERFTTGLAAEVHDDNVRVNVLSPTSIVPTPGVVHHELLTARARAADRAGRSDGGGGAGPRDRSAGADRAGRLQPAAAVGAGVSGRSRSTSCW